MQNGGTEGAPRGDGPSLKKRKVGPTFFLHFFATQFTRVNFVTPHARAAARTLMNKAN